MASERVSAVARDALFGGEREKGFLVAKASEKTAVMRN